MSEHIGSYLKKHSEALVKDLGIEAAARICGKSKATLGRYYSNDPDNSERFMPLDVAARLEAEASYPHVTVALADLAGVTLSWNEERRNASSGSINSDVVALSQRFAMLMAEYHVSIADGTISLNEAKRMLKEAQALQEVLLQVKLKLEEGAVG
ncbi:phage regulatory CII family protein [uncultured Thioclava sp.]|uniref:phage regulatory CII family protein n=1 Tax=uncultured Thioclava sp. TaxID=473858 RepID=UPI0025FFB52B|nr:phage regulatory CII family protein [uncultured Thioclava sp.]